MKKSEAILRLSGNMQKHENILKGYAKGSITLKCTCDNLAIYLLDELERMGMLPPELPSASNKETCNYWGESLSEFHEWEDEDE